MSTPRRLGQNPHQFEGMPPILGAVFVGVPLSFTIDVDDEGVPVAIRVHDGSTPGGRLTALVNPNTVTGALPAAVVVPEISLSLTGSVPENVHHTLGYKPFVSLLDGTGQAVSADEYTIVHHDDDNFSITSTADGTFSLLLR